METRAIKDSVQKNNRLSSFRNSDGFLLEVEMEIVCEMLKKHNNEEQPNVGDRESVFALLHEAYGECSRLDDVIEKDGSEFLDAIFVFLIFLKQFGNLSENYRD